MIYDATLLEQGRFKVDVQRVDLFEVPCFDRSHQCGSQNCRDQFALIAPKEKLTVAADPSRLRQCLINLLSNAIIQPTGEVALMSLFHDSNHVVLSVSDTGEGMSEVDIARLFLTIRKTKTKLDQASLERGWAWRFRRCLLKRWVETQP